MTQTTTSSGIGRASVWVAAGTGLSRLTGFVRVWFLAHVLGGGDLSDAFIVGNNLPNQVYELLLGGLLTAQLVPMFVHHFETDDDDSVSAVVGASLVLLLGLILGNLHVIAERRKSPIAERSKTMKLASILPSIAGIFAFISWLQLVPQGDLVNSAMACPANAAAVTSALMSSIARD